jgi:hypothetical protein
MSNAEVQMDLDEAVAEVLGILTGMDLQYIPEQDRYQAIVRALNRALRAVALDNEWSYYHSVENVGFAHEGTDRVDLRSSVRPRIINDDAVRLMDPTTLQVAEWAYFTPRDALHKMTDTSKLWVSHTRTTLEFSRRFYVGEDGLEIHVPVMREPKMFRLPEQPEDPDEPLVTVPTEIREQLVDFDYPDLVIRRAAYFYAQTSPIMQPRVQTLEANYKELMYALVERDTRNTDTPYMNEWNLGIESNIYGTGPYAHRPSADFSSERMF